MGFFWKVCVSFLLKSNRVGTDGVSSKESLQWINYVKTFCCGKCILERSVWAAHILPFERYSWWFTVSSSDKIYQESFLLWVMGRLFRIYPFYKNCAALWTQTIFFKGEKKSAKLKLHSSWMLTWWEGAVLDCAVFLMSVNLLSHFSWDYRLLTVEWCRCYMVL